MNPWASLHPINRIRVRLVLRLLAVVITAYALALLATDYYATLDDEPTDTLALAQAATLIAAALLVGSLLAYIRAAVIPVWQGLVDLGRRRKQATANVEEFAKALDDQMDIKADS